MAVTNNEKETRVGAEDTKVLIPLDELPTTALENVLQFVPDLTQKLSKANLAPRLVSKRWKTTYESAFCTAYNQSRSPGKKPYCLQPMGYKVADEPLKRNQPIFKRLTVFVSPASDTELDFTFLHPYRNMVMGRIKTDFPAHEFAKNKDSILNLLQKHVSQNYALERQIREINYLLNFEHDILKPFSHLSQRARRTRTIAILEELNNNILGDSIFGYLKREALLDEINILILEDKIEKKN